jgi:hypothetical protein
MKLRDFVNKIVWMRNQNDDSIGEGRCRARRSQITNIEVVATGGLMSAAPSLKL